MEILTAPHPMLTTICRADFVLEINVLAEMFDLMFKNNGIGLAAPQVGLPHRFFITAWHEVFVNPKIVKTSPIQIPVREGCLSLPGKTYKVWRHEWITLDSGETFDGEKAIVIQHELGHLDGKLISEIGRLA